MCDLEAKTTIDLYFPSLAHHLQNILFMRPVITEFERLHTSRRFKKCTSIGESSNCPSERKMVCALEMCHLTKCFLKLYQSYLKPYKNQVAFWSMYKTSH